MNTRLKKLRSQLAEKGVDAVIITHADNRRYLSGFHGTAGYLVITDKQAILSTDFRYVEQAKKEAPDFEIKQVSGNIKDWLPALASSLKMNQLGFEGGDVTYDFFSQLQHILKIVRLVSVKGLVEEIRVIKEPEEIKLIKKAAEITDAAFEYVEPKIKAGMTENQVAWELEKALHERGSQSLPFDIIVASGPNAALPHAKPSDRVINEGEPIMIDMGAKHQGYVSDFTRTICIGKTTPKFKEIYNIVLEAQQTAIAQIHSGLTGNEADSLSRKVIEKAGYGETFGHSLGHGVGLAEHEMPYLSPNSKEKLTDNMVFTIEPGIYISGWGGVRIEDTVVMEKGKVKPLTKARKITC